VRISTGRPAAISSRVLLSELWCNNHTHSYSILNSYSNDPVAITRILREIPWDQCRAIPIISVAVCTSLKTGEPRLQKQRNDADDRRNRRRVTCTDLHCKTPWCSYASHEIGHFGLLLSFDSGNQREIGTCCVSLDKPTLSVLRVRPREPAVDPR